MNRVRGKTAIITGAGRGIGRACAMLLAEAGAAVYLVDRDDSVSSMDAIVGSEGLSIRGASRGAVLTMTRDAAWGVLYLASDEPRWVTGTQLRIDGGVTAG